MTARHSGVGGSIKESIEDFVVAEVPLYRPSDRGEHTYFELEKSDMATLEAVERIAYALGVPSSEIGFAGLKDRKAITRQMLSVRLVSPERVLALRLTQMRVLWARRHTNKLRVGHLRGNRFRIVVRGVSTTESARRSMEAIIAEIRRHGMPNYYGPQRFGVRGDAFRIGLALLNQENEHAIARIVGYPSIVERNPHVLVARRRYMEGDVGAALEAFPRSYRAERELLGYLRQSGGNYRGAVKRLPATVRRMYYSALQSSLFNSLLEKRLELSRCRPGYLLEGDLAFLMRNGAVFKVVDLEREQERSRHFEIAPSGPMFGKLMPWPDGIEGELERDALRRLGLRLEDFHRLMPGLHMRGSRRPFRVEVQELRWELDGRDLRFEFFLPKGCYATTFLRELMKNDEVPPAFYTSAPQRIAIPALVESPPAVDDHGDHGAGDDAGDDPESETD